MAKFKKAYVIDPKTGKREEVTEERLPHQLRKSEQVSWGGTIKETPLDRVKGAAADKAVNVANRIIDGFLSKRGK